jgi:general secretion pathway protein L
MARSEWLLLRLPSGTGEAPSWAAIGADGALTSTGSEGGDPAALAVGRQVALVVPAADIALFAVQLPPGNEQRLQQLAPFALEEQVSQDLDQLHFAVGARDGVSGMVPVAVADRERLGHWLAQAAALSLRPRALFAESDLVPLLPGHVTLLIDGEQLILRHDSGRPLVFPADDPQLALSMLLGPETGIGTVNLIVYASPEDWSRHEAVLEALRAQVATFRVQLYTAGLPALLVQGIDSTSPVNLLQGAFKPHSPAANQWQRWRFAALLVLGLLAVHSAGSLWETRGLAKQSTGLDEEIARVYGTIFPGQKPGPALRRALEAQLQSLASGGAQRGELMPLLAALAAARANVPGAKLDSVSYKPGSLQLKLTAQDATTLEQFSQAVRAGGFGASVSSGSQSDGGFQGTVDVTESGT